MTRIVSDSQQFRSYVGKAIPGATDRQQRIPGFDQAVYSKSSVVCVGAGGLIGQIAPTLVRKGIEQLVPELGRRVSGYVLEAPYRDLEKACRDRLTYIHRARHHNAVDG